VRTTSFGGQNVRAGDFIGLVDDDLRVVAVTLEDAAAETVARMMFEGASLLTLYAGRDMTDEDGSKIAESMRQRWPEIEVEVVRGDQPYYPYLISLE
jgi:dihydroxyacetone kinase-like predicted kinase